MPKYRVEGRYLISREIDKEVEAKDAAEAKATVIMDDEYDTQTVIEDDDFTVEEID